MPFHSWMTQQLLSLHSPLLVTGGNPAWELHLNYSSDEGWQRALSIPWVFPCQSQWLSYFLWYITIGILANGLNLVQIYIMLQSCQACSGTIAKDRSDSELLSVAFTCFITEMRFIARFANNSLKTATGVAMLEAGSFCHFALVAFLLQTHLWRYAANFSYRSLNALADLVSWVFWCFETDSHINCLAAIASGAVVSAETVSSHMLIWEFKEMIAVLTFNSFSLHVIQVGFCCWSQPSF